MKLNTKQDFTDLMHRILDPLLPCYSAGGARLHLGETGASYDRNAIELEAFSRPLWALAPFWLGGGSAPEFERIYQAGLDHGTDPAHPEYWGDTKDYDQCFVEMAAIACAILEVPEKAWEPLNPEARTHLAAWLGTINHHELPNCNWLFFRVLVNLALRSVDMPWDPALLEQDLQNAESWYIGDGWYSDGSPEVKPQRDYYIPWALQYYGVLYSVFAAKEDPERAARFRQRAMEFGSQFMTWFDADGAALPYGRSLTYRFGQCAFYSACIWAGLEPLPLPVMKGIIVRNLQWWMSKPIFDRSGVLTVGYCYPQFFMSERYNAPGSPYWGLKTFIVLGLPDNHPFWTAEAAPLPVQPLQNFLVASAGPGEGRPLNFIQYKIIHKIQWVFITEGFCDGRGVKNHGHPPAVGLLHDVAHFIDLVLQNQKIARAEMSQHAVNVGPGQLHIGAAVHNDTVLPLLVNLNEGVSAGAIQGLKIAVVHPALPQGLPQYFAVRAHGAGVINRPIPGPGRRDGLVEPLPPAEHLISLGRNGLSGPYKLLDMVGSVLVQRPEIENLVQCSPLLSSGPGSTGPLSPAARACPPRMDFL